MTDGTVQQHVKDLGGQVGVTTRNAIVAKVLASASAFAGIVEFDPTSPAGD